MGIKWCLHIGYMESGKVRWAKWELQTNKSAPAPIWSRYTNISILMSLSYSFRLNKYVTIPLSGLKRFIMFEGWLDACTANISVLQTLQYFLHAMFDTLNPNIWLSVASVYCPSGLLSQTPMIIVPFETLQALIRNSVNEIVGQSSLWLKSPVWVQCDKCVLTYWLILTFGLVGHACITLDWIHVLWLIVFWLWSVVWTQLHLAELSSYT